MECTHVLVSIYINIISSLSSCSYKIPNSVKDQLLHVCMMVSKSYFEEMSKFIYIYKEHEVRNLLSKLCFLLSPSYYNYS